MRKDINTKSTRSSFVVWNDEMVKSILNVMIMWWFLFVVSNLSIYLSLSILCFFFFLLVCPFVFLVSLHNGEGRKRKEKMDKNNKNNVYFCLLVCLTLPPKLGNWAIISKKKGKFKLVFLVLNGLKK